jgi:hypothetical protein
VAKPARCFASLQATITPLRTGNVKPDRLKYTTVAAAHAVPSPHDASEDDNDDPDVALSPGGALCRARTACASPLLAKRSPSCGDVEDKSADELVLRLGLGLRAPTRGEISMTLHAAPSLRCGGTGQRAPSAREQTLRYARGPGDVRAQPREFACGRGRRQVEASWRARTWAVGAQPLARELSSHPAQGPRTARTQARELVW